MKKTTRTVRIPAIIAAHVCDRLQQRSQPDDSIRSELIRRITELSSQRTDKLELNRQEAHTLREDLLPSPGRSKLSQSALRSWVTLWRRCGQVVYALTDWVVRFLESFEKHRAVTNQDEAALWALTDITGDRPVVQNVLGGVRITLANHSAVGETILAASNNLVASLKYPK